MRSRARRQELVLRFSGFAAVGATGTAVHMLVLWLALRLGIGFFTAQGYAVVVAMTWNFLVNNTLTYRDRRLRGGDMLKGVASYYAVAAIGGLFNLTTGDLAYIAGAPWWLAAAGGAAAGLGWNFGMTRLLTWRGGAAGQGAPPA